MRKIMLYVVSLVFLIFVIPACFTKVTVESSSLANNKKSEENTKEQEENKKYYYREYNTIKLLNTKTNNVEEIALEDYLYGVVSAEMPANFELEALKAQAVVARTYTLYKITQNDAKHGNAHICTDSKCCQAWISKEDRLAKWDEDKREENWNKIVLAVDSTKGVVITYSGNVINAFFHSNSGGTTEAPVDVWGGSRLSIFANCSNIW